MDKLPTQTIKTIIEKTYGGDQQAFLRDVEGYVRQSSAQVRVPQVVVDPDAPVLVELKDVTRTYKLNRKNQVAAVQGVSLQVRTGEIVALTGPSGSGKSTLMQLIGGLDRPTSGEVIVDNNSVEKLSESELARYRNRMIGFVFQFFYLQPFLRVNRNIETPLMFARTNVRDRQAVVDEVVEAVSLSEKKTALPKELSGGQIQRVAIARALVNKPKLLLADEPTGNLDSKTSDRIMELLHTIRKTHGTTMIIVTHDPRVASWADRTIRIEDGKVVA